MTAIWTGLAAGGDQCRYGLLQKAGLLWALLILVLLAAPSGASAQESGTTLMPYGDGGYSYEVVPHGDLPGFPTTYDPSGFASATAPFSNGGCGFAQTTNWPADTDLLAVHSVDVPAGASGVSVSVGIDNDIAVYWDGTQIGADTHDGCASNDSFTYQVPAALAQPGEHRVAFRAIDRGAATYFDATVREGPLSLSDNCRPPNGGDGQVGTSFSCVVNASGGTPPYQWHVAAATPPDGLSPTIATSAVTIAGKPPYAGTADFNVSVTDSSASPQTASETVPITIASAGNPTTWPLLLNAQCANIFTDCGTPSSNTGPVVVNPHVAIVLVGNWWCGISTLISSQPICRSHGAPAGSNGGLDSTEQGRFLGAIDRLISQDYSSEYDDQLAQFFEVTGCGFLGIGCTTTYVGPGIDQLSDSSNGACVPCAFAGPIDEHRVMNDPATETTLGHLASAFGVGGDQRHHPDTVFLLLFAPNKLKCPNPSGNGQPPVGKAFVFAKVYLEDTNTKDSCAGDLTGRGPANIVSTEQFATYATSHELDEAITSPGSAIGGWLIPPSFQIADPCRLRNADGETQAPVSEGGHAGYPYNNFTRDSLGTVVAAYVAQLGEADFTDVCTPDGSTAIPPG